MSVKQYIKNAIHLIYHGDSKFYYEQEKELFRSLIDFMNEKIVSLEAFGKEGLLSMIDASNKTVTNIGENAEIVNRALRQLIRDAATTRMKEGRLPFSIKIVHGKEEISLDPEETSYFLELMGKQAQHISGRIRSEFGKEVERVYLSVTFQSLGISETTKKTVEAIQTSGTTFLEEGLYYVMGAKFQVISDHLKLYGKGKEVDAMVYLYDGDRITYLLAMEFTLSGPGNPTFQRNKANDMHVKFGGYTGLLYTAFDLGTDMRARIEEDVETVFFKDDTETRLLLKIYGLLEKQLRDKGYDPAAYLPPKEDSERKFRELISGL